MLDTSEYDVVFEDRNVETYFANQIAEAIYANVDDKGYTVAHLKEFLDHKKDGSAVHADDGHIELNGKRKPRRTTKGWKMCASLADRSTEWIDLQLTKEAYPVQVAEYAVANKQICTRTCF